MRLFMKMTGWFFRPIRQRPSPARIQRIAGSLGTAALLMTAGIAVAQAPAPVTQPVAPEGYTLHESIDLGGRLDGVSGSGAMYDTMINLHTGPRVLGETFELRALPGKKNTLVDSLSAFSDGFGGDPNNYARLNFHKGDVYEFSGLFRRDRQYFDYDLLDNPNILGGQSIPIGPSNAPTGSFAWPQVEQSPVLFNTVRRMTDTNLAIFPLARVTYRVAYSQNIFEGPSLSPGASSNFFDGSVGAYDQLLEEHQRNSADDFIGGIDWKPVLATKVTFEEEIDHYKEDSYFTLAPRDFTLQEADGTKVSIGNWDSTTPYGIGGCNAGSMGSGYTSPTQYTILSAPQTPGGLPVINPACDVATSYLRSQPTRLLFPTEIFRFQSSSLRNIAMNGDFRFTEAKMDLPSYYENFQGLDGSIRSTTFTGTASAKRDVTAADYALTWQATKTFDLADQIDYSDVHQPGTADISTGITANTPTTAGNETINYAGPLVAGKNFSVEGSPNGAPLRDYFGQKFLTNNLTGTWDGWSRATLSLTWRTGVHTIGEGIPHSGPLAVGADTGGTVTIHENGGIFNAALRPTSQWDLNGTIEALYADNAFTPVGPRQTRHYRVHTLYRPRPWLTLSGVFNDLERHNNTNNNQSTVAAADVTYDGPINHVDHSRIVSVGGVIAPNEHYSLDFSYAYSDVYAATNICYDAGASSTLPGAATASGTACPGATVRGTTYYEFGPARDFMDAPTQFASVALGLSPDKSVHYDLGYRISAVNGNQFFNNAQEVNGSLDSTYQSPFAKVAYTVHPGWIWRAEYNYFGYGEGGPSGAPYCSTTNPTPSAPAAVVPCNSPTLAGLPTGLTEPASGLTAARNFHANNVTLGFHYEF
jgi:hypothetical protein